MSDRTPLYLALLVVSLVVGALLLREPLFGRYRAMGHEIDQLEAQLAGLNQELAARQANAPLLITLAESFGPDLDRGQRGMAAASFYGRVAQLASACGLRVENLGPRPEEMTEDGLLHFGCSLNLSGDLKGITAFLAQLQSSVRLVGIERLVVRRAQAADQPLALQATLVSYGLADRDTRQRLAQEAAKKEADRRRLLGTRAPSAAAGVTQ